MKKLNQSKKNGFSFIRMRNELVAVIINVIVDYVRNIVIYAIIINANRKSIKFMFICIN